MAELTKGAINAASDLTKELVAVPEWGGEVWVRVMDGTDRDSLETSCQSKEDEPAANFRAKVLVRSLCASDNTRLFEDDDAEALGKKSIVALERVFEVATRINALSAKVVEDVAKNLPSDQSEDSGSNSPTDTAGQ